MSYVWSFVCFYIVCYGCGCDCDDFCDYGYCGDDGMGSEIVSGCFFCYDSSCYFCDGVSGVGYYCGFGFYVYFCDC